MKTKAGITLAVSHNIYLTEAQRYTLANGENITTSGVSVPIWYFKGRSSEPGVEVFNQYTLLNSASNDIDIDQSKDGYTINIPAAQDPKFASDVPQELWSKMSEAQKMEYLSEIPTGDALRNPIDGGSRMLCFNQYNKSRVKGIPIHVLHFIRIADLGILYDSLV